MARRIVLLLGSAVPLLFPCLVVAQDIPTAPHLPATRETAGPAFPPQPTIIVGDPSIPGFPTATGAINANSPDSPFAGVVSVYGAISTTNGVKGSGVAIDRYHILTAAHVVDFFGGLTPQGAVTGDGVVDALIPDSRIFVNNIAAPVPYHIAAIQLVPQWYGFRNILGADTDSVHDDVAILTLSEPLPESVPTYAIYRTPFETDTGKLLLFAGYGQGGDAISGVTQPASFDSKRYGWNVTVVYDTQEDLPFGPKAEVYFGDFDPPAADGGADFSLTGFDGIPSLGNDFEAIIAPGDSGGPAFIIDDLNNDGFLTANELTLFGLTTFTFDTADGGWPHFGAAFGGPILSAYADFIDAAVPEPGTLSMAALAVPWLLRRQDRRR